jgi:hypothetical protein
MIFFMHLSYHIVSSRQAGTFHIRETTHGMTAVDHANGLSRWFRSFLAVISNLRNGACCRDNGAVPIRKATGVLDLESTLKNMQGNVVCCKSPPSA